MDDGVWVLQERLEMRPDLLGGRTHFGEPFLSYWNGEHLALYFFCAALSSPLLESVQQHYLHVVSYSTMCHS